MINSIHQSMLSMALRCQEQFRRRYLLGEIIPPSIPAGKGTALHRTNEINLTQKIKTGENLKLSDMHDVARDGFMHALSGGVYLARDQIASKKKLLNQALNDTISLTNIYHDDVAPLISDPIGVEQNFAVNIGLDLPLAGRIDFIQPKKVFDLKTTSKSWGANDAIKKGLIQACFYTLARQIETKQTHEFTYYIMVNSAKTKKVQIQSITPTKQQYRILFNLLKKFCQMLKVGIFMPADPSSWICSEAFCGYYMTCKYVGN